MEILDWDNLTLVEEPFINKVIHKLIRYLKTYLIEI